MKTYEEILEGLKEIKKGQFVKTHRSDDTGVGKTLEDILEIEENNFDGPDGHLTELKSARKHSSSMLTLFTKSPLPRGINSKLRAEYGYPDDEFKDKKSLHTTRNANDYNNIKKEKGFKLVDKGNTIEIQPFRPPSDPDMPTAYWEKSVLQKRVEKKYVHQLLYVKADSKGEGKDEEFHYTDAYILRGFSPKNFFAKLANGVLDIDIRLGYYHTGKNRGKPHDHGTGVRIRPSLLDECFSFRKKVL